MHQLSFRISVHSIFPSLCLLKCVFVTSTGCMWPCPRADTEQDSPLPSPASFPFWHWVRSVKTAWDAGCKVNEISSWLLDNYLFFFLSSLVLSSGTSVMSDWLLPTHSIPTGVNLFEAQCTNRLNTLQRYFIHLPPDGGLGGKTM